MARDIGKLSSWDPSILPRLIYLGTWTDNQNYLLASRHTQQIYDHFELLFCFEGLNDSSNDTTGVSNQLWNKVSLFDYIPERICACKKVRKGWAEDLALSLPLKFFFIYKQPLPKEGGGLSLRARNPK